MKPFIYFILYIASSPDETEYTDINEMYRITNRVRCRTCTKLKLSMAIEFLLRKLTRYEYMIS